MPSFPSLNLALLFQVSSNVGFYNSGSMKQTYQAVVAQYHVESSEEDEDEDNAHEMDGLMSYHQHEKWRHHHKTASIMGHGDGGESFAMNAISSEEDDQGREKTGE